MSVKEIDEIRVGAGSARRALPLRPLPRWPKMKNPEAPAVKREAEEDWGR
jgi:hypothetical protein